MITWGNIKWGRDGQRGFYFLKKFYVYFNDKTNRNTGSKQIQNTETLLNLFYTYTKNTG